jgi:hypothetical protein
MPHPKNKKQRITDAGATLAGVVATAGDLSTDVLANILGYLGGPKSIMRQRGVSKKWSEAVKKTIVPSSTDVFVDDMKSYNAVEVMTTVMPNLQNITISDLGDRQKWSDGEDPEEYVAQEYADHTSYDIEIISNFTKLRILKIEWGQDRLNGRYPFLFNSYPLLQKLSIQWCYYLKWDLEMLASLPMLKELECSDNRCLTGNIKSLRVLKETLEKVKIVVANVEGNFMDLADFPHLKALNLESTAVTGDIRDVGGNDFPMLERLSLPRRVYGGKGYEVQSISDAPEFIRTIYLIKKQRPTLKMEYWFAKLSRDSPDWYESLTDYYRPPFNICLVEAGSRIGYQWGCPANNSCEVNWLDPEPDRESIDYEKYTEELQGIEKQVHKSLYRGFNQPPSEEEYRGLIEYYDEESEESDSESENYEDEDYNVDDYDLPPLRFEVGQRVACRVGRDPVNGWAPGRISQLWYRERTWPANALAAYKIELDDGRNIYAPNDVDELIRAAN